MEDRIYRRSAQLLEADIGDELVALDTEGGHCFGFNSVASFVWKQLEHPRSVGQLAEALREHYDVDPETCAADLADLLEQLERQGLIEALAAPAGKP